MSDIVLPLLVVYVFYFNPIVKVLVTYVTPDCFLHVDGFPSDWSLCHFYIRDNRSYWTLELWILHFRDNIGMYWLYLWLLIYLNLV